MNDYTGWLFIDMADLTESAEGYTVDDWKAAFPGCLVKGTRQKLVGEWSQVEYISVAHTSVGHTILDRCPNLKGVLVRGHADVCVDMEACRSRGVKVISAGAFARNCAEYIRCHIKEHPVLFYGFGRIPRIVAAGLADNWMSVDSKSTRSQIESYVHLSRTIVASVPPTRNKRPPVFGQSFFNLCSGQRFISICHEPLINYEALINAVESGRISHAVLDTIEDKLEERLLGTGKIEWTRDSAWKTNFKQKEYQEIIKEAMDRLCKSHQS